MYLQNEDNGNEVEQALSNLHSSLIISSPSLLPSFKNVFDAVHKDRAKSVQQKAAILGLGGVGLTPVEKQQQIQNRNSTRLSEGKRSTMRNNDTTKHRDNLNNFNALNKMDRINEMNKFAHTNSYRRIN